MTSCPVVNYSSPYAVGEYFVVAYVSVALIMLAVACFADYDYVAGSLNDFDVDDEDSSCCYFDYLIAFSERADLTLMN